MRSLTSYDITAGTHAGIVRLCNEDSYIYSIKESAINSLLVVADGIGGHERGDLASRICTQHIFRAWEQKGVCNEPSEEKITFFLTNEIKNINDYIYKLNKTIGTQTPMGTTIIAAILMDDKVITAHAGDSRLYRLRNAKLECLTQDHSFVGELLKRKIITNEESKSHPFAHIISKAIGTLLNFEPELNIFDIQEYDRLLLCSDGVTTHLEDPQIETILEDASDPYDAVKNLIYAALRGGGEDNITSICAFI
jgi:protein phosphatase